MYLYVSHLLTDDLKIDKIIRFNSLKFNLARNMNIQM